MKPPPGRIPACLCSASLSECHKVQWHRHPCCPSLRAPAVGVAPACVGPHPCVHACVCVRVCVCAGIPVVLSVWSGGSSAQQVQGRPVHETGSQVLGDLDELAGGGPGLVQVRAGGLLGRCGMTRRLPIGSRVRAAAWSSGGCPLLGSGSQPAGPDTSWRLPARPEAPFLCRKQLREPHRRTGPGRPLVPVLHCPSSTRQPGCGLVFSGSFILS